MPGHGIGEIISHRNAAFCESFIHSPLPSPPQPHTHTHTRVQCGQKWSSCYHWQVVVGSEEQESLQDSQGGHLCRCKTLFAFCLYVHYQSETTIFMRCEAKCPGRLQVNKLSHGSTQMQCQKWTLQKLLMFRTSRKNSSWNYVTLPLFIVA